MQNWIRPGLRRIGVNAEGSNYKVLAVFENEKPIQDSKLVYGIDGELQEEKEGIIESITPYTKAIFKIDEPPPNKTLSYSIAGARDDNTLPPSELLLEEATYSFPTFPENGPETIGLATCNGIERVPKSKSTDVWEDLARHKIGHQDDDMDLLLLAGDQIYADSIKDDYKRGELTQAELIHKYRKRYISSWTHPPIDKVLAQVPTGIMWDDHDIYNGYGSHDIRNGETSLRKEIFPAAEKNFTEFQHRGVSSSSNSWFSIKKPVF